MRKEDEDKLQTLVKSTGLSIETLRLIKQVENKVNERKEETKKTIDDQMGKQKEQSMSSLAS